MSPVRDILSRQGRHALQSLGGRRVLFAFDFDGTLAPLALHPTLVHAPTSICLKLKTLATLAPVAIVSGRSLADLRRFFPRFPGFLVGNHGAEGLSGNRAALRSARRACRAWRKHLLPVLSACRPSAGVWLEDKVFSLTVHCRSSVALELLRWHLRHDMPSSLPPMRFLPGKASVNLLPHSVPHKGKAIAVLLRRTRALSVLFVGDDETDEDVFSMKEHRMLTVRVGRGRRTHAAFLLRNQREIGRLLMELIELCRSSQ